jgi:hypothetical protein
MLINIVWNRLLFNAAGNGWYSTKAADRIGVSTMTPLPVVVERKRATIAARREGNKLVRKNQTI